MIDVRLIETSLLVSQLAFIFKRGELLTRSSIGDRGFRDQVRASFVLMDPLSYLHLRIAGERTERVMTIYRVPPGALVDL